MLLEKSLPICFLVSKGLSNDDVGMSMDTVLQEIYGRELVFKTGDFVKETLGGGGGYRRTSPSKV